MEPFSPFQAKVITHQWLHFCLATLGAVILVPDESSACSAVLVNVWTWLHVRARPPKTEETALGGRLAKMGHKMMNVAAFFSPVGLHLQDRRRRDCYHFSSTSTWTRLGMIYLRRKSTYSDIVASYCAKFWLKWQFVKFRLTYVEPNGFSHKGSKLSNFNTCHAKGNTKHGHTCQHGVSNFSVSIVSLASSLQNTPGLLDQS